MSGNWAVAVAAAFSASAAACEFAAGVEKIAADGTAALDGTRLSVSVPARLGCGWVKILGK